MLHIPFNHALVVYQGEGEEICQLYAKRPYFSVKKGDVVMVDKKALSWIKLRRLAYVQISPEDLVAALSPCDTPREGGMQGIFKRWFGVNDDDLLTRFEENPKSLSLAELKKLCKSFGISGYASMSAGELCDMITIDLNTPKAPPSEDE